MLGILTIIASWLIKLIGFPHQMRMIINSKSSKNISAPLISLTFFSYILWTVYGFVTNDIVIILGHAIGIIASGVTLLLLYKYKKL